MMSRLPESPGYWEKLTQHLVVDARDQLRQYKRDTSRRWHGLARFCIPLSVGAAAALIIALLRLPDAVRHRPEPASPASVYSFTPTDPLAALFATSAAAPTMAMLLSTPTSERTQ